MKRQEVSVDLSLMVVTALVYLGLAASGWILFRLIQACFWLPEYLRKQEEDTTEDSGEGGSAEGEDDKKNV